MNRTILIWLTAALIAGLIPTSSAANPAVGQYIKDIHSQSTQVRKYATVRLGEIGDKAAVPALIAALEDASVDVRREAANALAQIKDRRAVEPLIDALSDQDPNVRWYAAYALGELRDSRAVNPLVDALTDENWLVRKHAAWALRVIASQDAVAPLVKALKTGAMDPERAVWILKKINPDAAAQPLIDALKNAGPTGRQSAAYALGQLGIAGAVQPLTHALTDQSPRVRATAANALARIQDPAALDPLKDAAAHEKIPEVKDAMKEAVWGLMRAKGLLAYWSFDDCDGEIVEDLSGAATQGHILGATVVEGKSGSALKFDGEDDFIELGQPATIPVANAELTFLAWVNPEADIGVILARGGAWCGYSLFIQDGVAGFGIHREQEGPEYIAKGHTTIVGSWTHIAGVLANDSVKIYVNGALEGETHIPALIEHNAGQGLEIGFDVGNSPVGVTDHFKGIIDEVKIQKKAMTADEIAAEYQGAQ